MNFILMPAIISLILKIYIFWIVIKGGRASTVFLSLIAIFALHNTIETLTIGNMLFYENRYAEQLLRPYYIITAYSIMYIALYALTLSEIINRSITISIAAISTIISALILYSDHIVAGHYSIGYSVSAEKGEFYWLFAALVIIGMLFSCITLLYGYRNASTQIKATRCLYSLYAITPFLLTGLIIMFFKIFNIPISAVMVLPVATTLFLIITIKTESKHKLSEIKHLLPLSLERKTANNFLNMLDEYVQNSNEDNVYKNLQANIEREIICYSLNKCNNNISQTASMMGLKNRSTLYSMINRHGINLKERKLNSELQVKQPES